MIESQQLDRLPGMNVVGSDGQKIGKVDEVYVDDATGEPSFALVNTGLFGLRSSFVPLERADISDEDLQVAYTKDRVKDAPSVEPDGHLSPDEEDELYRYYELEAAAAREPVGTETPETDRQPGRTETPTTTETIGTAAGAETSATAGTPTDVEPEPTPPQGAPHEEPTTAERTETAAGAPTDVEPEPTPPQGAPHEEPTTAERTETAAGTPTGTEGEMTRSEEEVEITKRERPAGKVRLRKHVVTDQVTKTVPVEREEVHVEREPVDETDTATTTGGGTISEDEQEVQLTEEEVEVDKKTVPKEKVRLDKETHVDEETVDEEVAREEIDVAGLEESRQDQSR